MKNYKCDKCDTLIQKNNTPSSIGCPNGGNHRWRNLSNVGDRNYQCKKCSILIKSDSLPTSLGCSSGGNHSWSKL